MQSDGFVGTPGIPASDQIIGSASNGRSAAIGGDNIVRG
jgi:hypothetical protein